MSDYRNRLARGYAARDRKAISEAAALIRKYVAEGLDDYKNYSEAVDDYTGTNPDILADQYILHVYNDCYLDDDADCIYIETGLKPCMRNWGKPEPVQLSLF